MCLCTYVCVLSSHALPVHGVKTGSQQPEVDILVTEQILTILTNDLDTILPTRVKTSPGNSDYLMSSLLSEQNYF